MALMIIAAACLLLVLGSLIGMFLALGLTVSALATAVLSLVVAFYVVIELTD